MEHFLFAGEFMHFHELFWCHGFVVAYARDISSLSIFFSLSNEERLCHRFNQMMIRKVNFYEKRFTTSELFIHS